MNFIDHFMRYFIWLVFLPNLLLAQSPLNRVKGWQELTISEGLSQGMIFDLKQDAKGFLWIATKDGLNRYDGHNFKVFTHDPYNPFSLSDNACSALLIDRAGRLWVGALNTGLNLYDDRTGRFHHITISDQTRATTPNYEIRLLDEDPDGNIWIGTNVGKPFKIELPASLRQSFPDQADFTKQIRCTALNVSKEQTDRPNFFFSFNTNGQAITGIENGVFSFNWRKPTSLTKLNLFEGSTPVLFDMYQDSRQDYRFISTNNQLIAWHQGQKKTISLPNEGELSGNIKPIDKNTLAVTTTKHLWLLSPAELFRRDSLTVRQAFVAFPPNIFKATKILKDKTGTIWVGTSGYGLRKFNPSVKKFHLNLPNTSLSNLYVDRQGRTYTRFQLAYGQLDKAGDRLVPFLNPNLPDPDKRQRYMIQDSRGFFWVSNVNFQTQENQLFKFSTDWQLLKKYPLPAGITFGFTGNQTLEDKAGNLWIGAINGILLHFNTQTERFQTFDYQKLFSETGPQIETHALLADPNGTLWIGTQQGLVKAQSLWTKPIFSIYKNSTTNRRSLSNDFVLSLAPDPIQPERYLWIGTKGSGLERLDKQTEQFSHFTETHGLPNKVVYGILVDEFKNLWLSTNRGLAQFNPRTFLFRNYTKADGLQDDEFNTNSFFKTAAGELLFGGVNGLTTFSPSELKGFDQKKPEINIIGLSVNNKPVEPGGDDQILAQRIEFTQAIELAHDQNLLTFEFGVMDFTNVGKNRFRYRLEGIDQDWVEAGTNRFANYAQLPDGHYTLTVQGSVDGEVWSEPVSLSIRVRPPFYRTWWAYLIYALVLGGLGWQFYRVQRGRLLLQQQVAFEHREASRLSELNALKTQFFTNISHEFRTPLTLILGPLNNRKQKPLDEPEMAMMERNGNRLTTLINQLLDLSKLEARQLAPTPEPGDLAAFFRTMAGSFSSLAESRGNPFVFEQSESEVYALFDRDKLEKITTNLLSNAFKFTPPGRPVRMQVRYEGSSDNRQVVFRVADEGIGIAPIHLPHIFDRFYQADGNSNRNYEGTGIGLALVHELVQVLGGSIQVESEVGKGTTFTVQIKSPSPPNRPVGPPPLGGTAGASFSAKGRFVDAPAVPPSGVRGLVPPLGGGGGLLLIDDNADIRAYVRSVFEGEYEIIEAEDGQQGLELATEHTPDLVICDLMMPRLDGFGFCRALKTQDATSHIPVVMLTAKATLEDRIEGFELGADDYLTKPFQADELRVRVRNLLDKQERLRQYFGKTVVAMPEAATSSVIPSREDIFLQKARELVEKNLGSNAFGVEEFGRELGLSQSQLLRKLKALTGLTAVEFVRQYRLERAATLLAGRTGNVSEIAYQVGFESLPYFTKVFQEKYGVLPSEYGG